MSQSKRKWQPIDIVLVVGGFAVWLLVVAHDKGLYRREFSAIQYDLDSKYRSLCYGTAKAVFPVDRSDYALFQRYCTREVFCEHACGQAAPCSGAAPWMVVSLKADGWTVRDRRGDGSFLLTRFDRAHSQLVVYTKGPECGYATTWRGRPWGASPSPSPSPARVPASP